MRDQSSNLKITQLFAPVVSNTGNTAVVSTIIDTALYDACTLCWTMGAIADADVTFTVLIEDGNDSALADNATVAAGLLVGGVAGVITSGASDGSGCTPGFADDNKTFRVGYLGNKRYLRVTITPAANTGALYMAGVAILGQPRSEPVTSQKA